MKKTIICITLLMSTTMLCAQPKWTKNAQKALVSLYAVENGGDTLKTNAFFINETGSIVAPLIAIQQAQEAWIQDYKGNILPIIHIEGYDKTYNVVRLRANLGKKKATTIATSNETLTRNDFVYLMPSGTEDKIVQVEKTGEYGYYTLSTPSDKQLEGMPLMNEDGKIVGIIQVPIDLKKAPCYALSIAGIEQLKISAMDVNSSALQGCGILKQLPSDESQAQTFLYLCNANNQTRLKYADAFITAFPQSSVGYCQKAEILATEGNYTLADETYSNGIKSGVKATDEILYSRSQAIYQLNLQGASLPDNWTLAQALEDIQKAYAQNPLPAYTLHEARILYVQKDYNGAYNDFMSLTKTNFRSPDLFLYAAQCKENMGADKEEILALNDSTMSFYTRPYTAEAAPYIWARARTLKNMEKYRKAINDYNDYEHLFPGQMTDQFYYEREQMEVRSRLLAQAIEDIEKAITKNPQEPLYHAERAGLMYRAGNPDEGIISCKKAIELDDQFADAYRLYGICLREKGETARAKEQLRKAVELGDEIAQDILTKMQ